jgi:hypothetical protein
MNSYATNRNGDPLFVDLLSNGGFKAVFGDVNNKVQYYFMCRDATYCRYFLLDKYKDCTFGHKFVKIR